MYISFLLQFGDDSCIRCTHTMPACIYMWYTVTYNLLLMYCVLDCCGDSLGQVSNTTFTVYLGSSLIHCVCIGVAPFDWSCRDLLRGSKSNAGTKVQTWSPSTWGCIEHHRPPDIYGADSWNLGSEFAAFSILALNLSHYLGKLCLYAFSDPNLGSTKWLCTPLPSTRYQAHSFCSLVSFIN